MTICFSAEMQIESKNCNISIFIFSKIETKTSNTNVLLFAFFSFKLWESKMWNSFLIVLDIKFVNWLMVNDYLTVIGYQAFIAKYSYVIDLTLHGLLIIQKGPLEAFCKIVLPISVNFIGKHLWWSLFLIRENIIKKYIKKRLQCRRFPAKLWDF